MAATALASIHNNGTSVDALLDQQRCIAIAAEHLMYALRQSVPHGRDYYVQDNAALKTAQAEHAARVQSVQDILDDTQVIVEHLFAAGAKDNLDDSQAIAEHLFAAST